MRRSNEPFFWALFSAGGTILALILPALIVLTGFLVAAEEIEFAELKELFGNWLIRLVIFGVVSLAFFHAAHRIRHTIKDMGLHAGHMLVSAISYLAALAGSVWAAYVVIA